MRPIRSRNFFLRSAGALASVPAVFGRASAADTFTLRSSIPLGPGTLYYSAATRMATAVEQRSNGRLHIEVYPSGQLAKEQESIQGLRTGTVDLTMQSSTWLSSIAPEYALLDLPFMFRNTSSAYRVADSDIGTQLFAQLDGAGITGLGWGPGGFREIETSERPIRRVADLKGARLRIQNGGVYVAMVQALNAVPVAVDFSETYTALAQHTVDGLEISLDPFVAGKLYEVVKHVAMSNHIFTFAPMLASKQKLNALPPDLQTILREEARSAIGFWRALYDQKAIANENMLKGRGLTFTQIDFPEFRRAMEPVYLSYQSKFGKGMMDRVARLTA